MVGQRRPRGAKEEVEVDTGVNSTDDVGGRQVSEQQRALSPSNAIHVGDC